MRTRPSQPLTKFADEMRQHLATVANLVGAPPAEAEADPLSVLPYLQGYLDRLPLAEFEVDDWVTLHADVVCFLATVVIARTGASWRTVEDHRSPHGYRYVLRVVDADGGNRDADPFEVALGEFHRRPVDVARMLDLLERSLKG